MVQAAKMWVVGKFGDQRWFSINKMEISRKGEGDKVGVYDVIEVSQQDLG